MKILRAIAGLMVAVALTACTTTDAGSATESKDTDTSHTAPEIVISPLPDGAQAPTFTSAWASEFEAAYRGSTSDLQRTILADETITDQELAALQDAFTTCLSSRGYTDISFASNGGFSERAPAGTSDDDENATVQTCEDIAWGSQGGLTYGLYFEVARNPARQDESEIMVACLVRQGLVDPSYTAEDYVSDSASGAPPFDPASVEFRECNANPLTAGTR
ncbi:hypothetical protein [Demequina capsici]|uniref:Lipoprotein n=1 Tax=Demequina capsici TaxID=3075620 RepID=A0AA96F5N6_9MICO|nr:hypothetical protein [Demequina sp. OYTSA14]WNM24288.1 hypothetical protein RN606_13135 [Demequina sp. OYTSA14]